ncbi:alkaline phosphatase [uncultured Bacteroides sp.]|uniref:alkaline phosphatase n=1 Tax=uncultured Bacteroides sp. TaxID=162156 RepID=UPI002614520F|nr:alkaline phosphatase [uncultured Bacteroides sp.]
MRKISFILLFILLSTYVALAQQAKYVFYFIGDGMGVNQVQGTELYRGELEGKIGISPIVFTQFPYATTATTFSATNGVTDSAAAGTALSTGNKTKNGALGVEKDLTTDVSSVAVWAQESGKRVGIATSVSIDHATPAAFYAHNPSRKNYYQIGLDLFKAGFDFYAGSDFLDPTNKKDTSGTAENLYQMIEKRGYTLARGYKDYLKKAKKAEKMILFQSEEASANDKTAIPYAIDRSKNDLTLSDITRSAINFLTKDSSKGFFLMVEGGKIDWACHSNDAATAFYEIIDMDEAVKVAYEFYAQHPDETLIVITADHETGGLVLGTGAYALNLQVLKNQKVSENGFTRILNYLRKKNNNKVSWEKVQKALKDNFGFWENVKLTQEQESRLESVYKESFEGLNGKMELSEYAQNEPLAAEAKRIIDEIAMVGWTSGGHSAGYVPVFAIGAGAELLQGRIDNTDIPKKIAKAAGYKIPE